MIKVRLRPHAEVDLVERTRYYRSEGSDELVGRFFDTAVESLRAIERMPGVGSPRIGEMCDVPGLRSHRIEGFPCDWFYFERHDHVDVVRCLAYARDIATILGDFDQDR